MERDKDITAEVLKAVKREGVEADPKVLKAVIAEVISTLTREGHIGDGETFRGMVTREKRDVHNQSGETGTTARGAGSPEDMYQCIKCYDTRDSEEGRGIITVTGRNRPGIIQALSEEITSFNCDIRDISQTIVGEFFTLIIVVDLRGLSSKGRTFMDLKEAITSRAKRTGIEAVVVHEKILNAMHRP